MNGNTKKAYAEEEAVLPADLLNQPIRNPVLYWRKVPVDYFVLVLSGTVGVCSGREGFAVEVGSFSVLGVEALTNEDY